MSPQCGPERYYLRDGIVRLQPHSSQHDFSGLHLLSRLAGSEDRISGINPFAQREMRGELVAEASGKRELVQERTQRQTVHYIAVSLVLFLGILVHVGRGAHLYLRNVPVPPETQLGQDVLPPHHLA